MAFAELLADPRQLLCFVLVFLWDCPTLASVSTGYSLTEKGLHPATQTTPSGLLDHSSQLEQTGNTRSGGGWAGRSVL